MTPPNPDAVCAANAQLKRREASINATKRRGLETIGDVENEWSVASKRNKTQKTQAVSGAVSRRKPKHFLEAKAREPPR